MGNTAIRISGLSKQYRIGGPVKHRSTLREALVTSTKLPFQRVAQLVTRRGDVTSKSDNMHWSLHDVSFEVKKGSALGIIGRNGAGKSTLLKILSRITEPTEGRVELFGRVGALLEVGTGFHAELTGRENIYLNGAILGMSRAEINRKFDEIVDFSGIERFIDTPVKHYSSGMGLRLGFAVAAHLEPEILLMDEVLAVGDAEFQKKCLGKMSDVASEGRTVLFVSHNLEAVQNLCDSALLLEQGKVRNMGDTASIIDEYLSRAVQNNLVAQWLLSDAPGNERAKLLKASVRSVDETVSATVFTTDDDLLFEFEFVNLLQGEHSLSITMHLQDERGILVFVSGTASTFDLRVRQGRIRGTCIVPRHLLNQGTYTVSRVQLVKDRAIILYMHPDVLTFDVIVGNEGRLGWMGRKEGVIRPRLEWTFTQPGDSQTEASE